MTRSNSILKAEVVDQWAETHAHVAQFLDNSFVTLERDIAQTFNAMPTKALLRMAKFQRDHIAPLVIHWQQKTCDALNEYLDAAVPVTKTGVADTWTSADRMKAGATLVFSIAPLASVPFVTGGLATGATTVLGYTVIASAPIPTAIAATVGGITLLAAGPVIRGKAETHLKSRFQDRVLRNLRLEILGQPTTPQTPSFKSGLLGQLEMAARTQLEALA